VGYHLLALAHLFRGETIGLGHHGNEVNPLVDLGDEGQIKLANSEIKRKRKV